MGKIIGQSNSRFPLAVMFNITAMITPNISCANNTTARSDRARLRSESRKVVGIDEAFCSARITRMFSEIDTKEHIKFKTQVCKKNFCGDKQVFRTPPFCGHINWSSCPT